MNAATHDIIALQDLRVTCLVGIHPTNASRRSPWWSN